jgi:hypothetical protein
MRDCRGRRLATCRRRRASPRGVAHLGPRLPNRGATRREGRAESLALSAPTPARRARRCETGVTPLSASRRRRRVDAVRRARPLRMDGSGPPVTAAFSEYRSSAASDAGPSGAWSSSAAVARSVSAPAPAHQAKHALRPAVGEEQVRWWHLVMVLLSPLGGGSRSGPGGGFLHRRYDVRRGSG